MASIPNLAGVATKDLVETIAGAGSFKASYINWARTFQMLREHAPGWMPELVHNKEGGYIHRAPVGAYLMLRFRHVDGAVTPEVPQAIMDNRNNSVAMDKITARDVTDTHRRGVCMAAAATFGLAYELWAKMPLETGFAEESKPKQKTVTPTDGAWESQSEESQEYLLTVATKVGEALEATGEQGAWEYLRDLNLDNDERIALWTRLDSKQRSGIKRGEKASKDAQG